MIVGCLYLPNGNPAPGPEIRLQAALVRAADAARRRAAGERRAGRARRRLQRHADRARRLQAGALGRRRAVPARGARRLSPACSTQGWTDALRALHPDERIYTFWDYFRNAFGRDAGLRIDHLLLSPPLREAASSPPVSTARCAAGKRRATMRPPGSSLQRQSEIARLRPEPAVQNGDLK